MVWLYAKTGTLLFYDGGAGCLEHSALAHLVAQSTVLGLTASTGIALLIFCGEPVSPGRSPCTFGYPTRWRARTPVSALIHARLWLRLESSSSRASIPDERPGRVLPHPSIALQVVTWTGAITAVFAALIAVAQFDIKRILAYSTISQLGYMMMDLALAAWL